MNSLIPIPEGVKGLIFDLDGTLIDSMPMHYEAYNHALKPYDVVYPKELFLSRAGIPTHDTLRMIEEENEILNFDIDSVLKGKREYIAANLSKVVLVEPVFDIVRHYHNKIPMSIGTGSHRNMVAQVMDLLKIDRFIDIIVTADDVENHKPHPDTFTKCAELMGVEPERCLVYEDGVPGMHAAEAAGMQLVDVRPYVGTILV